MKYLIRSITALAILAAPLVSQAPNTGPAHIILIRHGDKPADPSDPHLSPAGVARSKDLVKFVTTDPAIMALGTPVAIFATKTTKDDDGQRTQETVAPLAKTLLLCRRRTLARTSRHSPATSSPIRSTPARRC